MESFFNSLRDTPYNSETEEETSPRRALREVATSGQNSHDWLTNFRNSLFGEDDRDHHSPAQDSSDYITELIKGARQGISQASDLPGYRSSDQKDAYHHQEHTHDTYPQYTSGIHTSSSRDATGKSPDHLDLQHDITQREREASFCKHIERTTAIIRSVIHAYLENLNGKVEFTKNDRFKIIRKFSHKIIENTNTYQKGLVNTLDTLRKINQKFRKFARDNPDLFPPDSHQTLDNRLNTQAETFNRKFKFNEDWLKELTNTQLTLRQITQGLRKFAEGNPELFRPALQQELANTRELHTWAKNFKRKLDSNEDWVKEVMNQLGVEEQHFNKNYQEFLDNPQASYSIKNARYSPGDLAQQYKPNKILSSYDELFLANAKFKPIYERLKEVFPVEGIPDRSRVSDPPRYGSYENTEAYSNQEDIYNTYPEYRKASSQYGTAYDIPSSSSHDSTGKSPDSPEKQHYKTQKEAKELIEWAKTFTKRFDLGEDWVQAGIKQQLGIKLEDCESYQQLREHEETARKPYSLESYEELVMANAQLKSIHDLLKGGIPVKDMPDRICGRTVTQVSGRGNDCLIRALLKGARPKWEENVIEDGVIEMRQHLIETKIVEDGAMLDLGNLEEGKQLIKSMKETGWIEPDRDILAYQYLDGKIRCDPIAEGESNKPPYAVLFDSAGIHFYAIEVPE